MNKKEFLDNVTDQISYRPLRSEIRRELEEHIEDHMEEYEAEGLSARDAEERAVSDMGDGISIGVQINAVRHIQNTPLLIFMTLAFMLAGAAVSAYLSWLPEQASNGFLYFLPGTAFFLFTVYFGYPLFIRYRKWFAILLAAALACCILTTGLCSMGILTIWRIPLHSLLYFSLLLAVLLFPLLLYHFRKKGLGICIPAAFVWTALCLTAFLLQWRQVSCVILVTAAAAAGTAVFMAARGIFQSRNSPRKKTAILLLAVTGIFTASNFLFPAQREIWKSFLRPKSSVSSKWDDTYNSLLVRELLSRTPLSKGISLTPDEMIDYGTGRWYFETRDPDQISLVRSDFSNQQSFQKAWEAKKSSQSVVWYDTSNVTLYDILPQHYHNNYLISLLILQYGWGAGLLFLAFLAGYYLLLFSRIRKIRQPLASSLAFCCGLCLLGQTLLYILGNFGFQLGTFPVLPLLSEGRISILVNMFFLGFILSAYRYDRVSGFLLRSIQQDAPVTRLVGFPGITGSFLWRLSAAGQIPHKIRFHLPPHKAQHKTGSAHPCRSSSALPDRRIPLPSFPCPPENNASRR